MSPHPQVVAGYINAVSGMLRHFSLNGSTDIAVRVKAYAEACASRDYPLSVVQTAALRFVNHRVERSNHAFPPSSPEFCAECDEMIDREDRHRRLVSPPNMLPPPEPPKDDPVTRAAAALRMDAMVADIKANSEAGPLEEERKRRQKAMWEQIRARQEQDVREEIIARGDDPNTQVASSALVALLNQPRMPR